MFKHLLLTLHLLLSCALCAAQTPLKIITPDQPGGGMDALVRPLAEKLSVALGRPVVVENKVGALGRIAAQAVLGSPPDGNTVMITVQATMVISPHVYPIPYNTLTDFMPVTDLGRGSLLLLTPGTLPANNFKEFAQWLKTQPKGQVNYGTYSAGTISHFGSLLLGQELGVEMTGVHYKASGDQVKDLVPGVVSLGWGPAAGPVAQLVKSGRLKAFAYMGSKRLPSFPDVPTIRELGYPGVEADGWIGVFVAKGTSPAIVSQLQQDMAKIFASPDIRTLYLNFGFEPGGQTPDEFGKLVASDYQRYGDYIKKIGFKPE